ncbi:MAG: hypothetical protein A2X94_00350 [Bdellovibrionales bacterium GWB1_55_8]|nr:MAG: hypothetical protein A2X94_00350 [Bdellovibrionales bacterium GWB1_55_8]
MGHPTEQSDQRFKDILDSGHKWPGDYLFKFIVTQQSLSLASALFQSTSKNCELSFRQSANGKYVSISFTLLMNSGDEVLAIYRRARAIPGVIAL